MASVNCSLILKKYIKGLRTHLNANIIAWRPFLESPETFRAHFGCHYFLRILKTKTFSCLKLCNEFALSYLEILVKDKLFRISGSQFLEWLFGPEKFTGLSRNGPLDLSNNSNGRSFPVWAVCKIALTLNDNLK